MAVALSIASPALGSTITNLEPVVPTSVNENDLSIFDLDPAVVLAWAGTPGSTSRRMLKRDTGVYSEANLNFQYPVIPLDHSALVSGISCSGGSLTATLTSTAYNYASKQWASASNIVFITSVTGCGPDADNDYFHATSLTFSSSSLSFTAQGNSSTLQDVGKDVKLSWGHVGAAQVKRAADKEHVSSEKYMVFQLNTDASIYLDVCDTNSPASLVQGLHGQLEPFHARQQGKRP